jgi:hypothetical protein
MNKIVSQTAVVASIASICLVGGCERKVQGLTPDALQRLVERTGADACANLQIHGLVIAQIKDAVFRPSDPAEFIEGFDVRTDPAAATLKSVDKELKRTTCSVPILVGHGDDLAQFDVDYYVQPNADRTDFVISVRGMSAIGRQIEAMESSRGFTMEAFEAPGSMMQDGSGSSPLPSGTMAPFIPSDDERVANAPSAADMAAASDIPSAEATAADGRK